ncbi:MAG: autotransporter domain-containing protein [Rhodoferax sp.]
MNATLSTRPCIRFTGRFTLKPLAAALVGVLALSAQAADEFTGLGFLGTGTQSFALGVSADGSVVVGKSIDSNFISEAFRWTSGGGMTGLGFLGTGTDSYATSVSADGGVVVGASRNNTYPVWEIGRYDYPSEIEAFRWTSGGGMTGLGFLGTGTGSYATSVSADGRVVVGSSQNGTISYEAFRWTSGGGMVGLGFLGTGTGSYATSVSADGGVVVGDSQNSSDNSEAFRWTSSGGMTGLGFLGTGTNSFARGVSADGGVVVGTSLNGVPNLEQFSWPLWNNVWISGGHINWVGEPVLIGVVAPNPPSDPKYEAFRWTSGGGMVGLGFLGTGVESMASAASADGSVVVGYSYDGSAHEAFRWTQTTGMQSVTDWLAGANVGIGQWQLHHASGINGNGNVVVGNGTDPSGNRQAWLARVGPAGSGFIGDIPAFNATLMEAGSRAVQAGAAIPSLAMFGGHHRSLLDNGLARTANGECAWATADAARHTGTGTSMELVEVGACKDVGSALLGLGMGTARSHQNWSQGGSAKYDGQYLYAEAANAFANGMEGSLAGYYGRFSTHMNRNYTNGSSVDTSSGRPDAKATALRARLDWKDVVTLGTFSLSPYAAYTWVKTGLDAYTEIGGGFPATYASVKWRTSDIRLGAAAKTMLSAATDLRLALEAAYRLDDSPTGVNGSVIGLWSFNQPGQKVEQTWGRLTADVDHRLSNRTVITVGANAATSGGDATWGVTAGLRMSF